MTSLRVLFEDNHLLVVAKPAGMLSQGDSTRDRNLLDLAKDYRKQREQKPGNVYVGLVHRLDRPVSGVMVLARTSKAASRLAEQFRVGSVQKQYWAAVERGKPAPTVPLAATLPEASEGGRWADWLLKDAAINRVAIVGHEAPGPPSPPPRVGAQYAVTHWRPLALAPDCALLELSPHTGRPHQLRVQAAFRGLPIWGDRKYGSTRDFAGNLALHAVRLTIQHPVARTPMTFTLPPPDSWARWGFTLPTLT